MSLLRVVQHRLRSAWVLFLVLGIAAGWKAADTLVTAVLPSVSAATSMFAETLLLTAFYGLLVWRLLLVPMQRRHVAVLLTATRDQRRFADVGVIDRPNPMAAGPKLAGRHLALVPEIPD